MSNTYLAVHFPGLFDAGDKVLIAIEIFLELRELFKRNVPLSTIIDCKLKSLLLTVPQVSVWVFFYCYYVHPLSFILYSVLGGGGAGLVQWWELFPSTNVDGDWFPNSTAYVGLVCWFSTLLQEVFLWVLQFSLLNKSHHFNCLVIHLI